MPTKAHKKRVRSEETPESDRGTPSGRISKRRRDASTYAAKVRKAVASMQSGRRLTRMSEHTRAVTLKAINSAIPLALRAMSGHKQKEGAELMQELSSNLASALDELEAPVNWCVGKDYGVLAAENHQIEESLLRNESHRLEMQQDISRLEKELEAEQSVLDKLQVEADKLQKQRRSPSELHPLLSRPAKHVGCHLDLDLEVPAGPVKRQYTERTQELRTAAATHLASIEAKTADKLKYLESVVCLKEQLSAVLIRAKQM